MDNVEERFWKKVKKTSGCWLWTGATIKGYGYFKTPWRKSNEYAHRVSWQLVCGEIPSGMRVLHKCDVPGCVRPTHLFLGTLKDNTQDAVAKDRMAFGERHGNSRLKTADVLDIRRRCVAGETHQSVANRFGLCRQYVSEIAAGLKWRRLEMK